MDTTVWMGFVFLLVLIEETLTQDQTGVKNSDENKDVVVYTVLSTLCVIVLISAVVLLYLYLYNRRHRIERSTQTSNEDTNSNMPLVTDKSADTVSIHSQAKREEKEN